MSVSDMPTVVSQLSRSQLTMVSKKGKEVAGGEDSSGKRKRDDDTAKTGHRRKRKNLGVLQFFEDAALEVDEDEASDDSDIGDDFLDIDFNTQVKVKNEPGKAHHLPFFLKKEELSEEELEKILEERYKPGSGLVTYAGDECNRLIERNAVMPLSSDPTIWKVKCMVGREKQSVFCLMQKYVDLHVLGTKLQIISAFALEHVKGFIYIEAERQFDINEACKGLFTIYSSRLAPVGKNEVSRSFSVQRKYNEVSVGTWVRVKNGKYKGDLAQVIAVNEARKRATVKLIPRIDMQAMAEKFGGGIASKKTAKPAPRLISSTEFEEFQPFIQYRHDRDTGQAFEVLDGLMLKDGYLYKKVSIDSLTFWGVMPSEDELLKFEPSKKEESDCEEWLTQLYGEQKEKRIIKSDKCVGKGKGSTSSSMASNFEVHDLVFFNQKGFGVIVGTEKDDHFKILKDDSEGPVVVTFELKQLKNGSFDKKFIALDHRMKTISINDTVRVLEGPLQGRQGIVKQIYRGAIFLYDENEQENSGIICCKSQICEKIILSDDARNGKGGKSGPPAFDNFLSSPKSPLSPKKPWKTRENNSNFNREDKDGIFSIGQSLRIRVGPLKGYLCHVLAIHRSDVTVKLDSQQKTLTVKCEHLSMVRGKSSAICSGADAESAKPLDLHGTRDCSGDWMAGAGTSTEGKGWGAGGLSTERNSCPALPSSGFSLQPESNFANPLISVDNDSNKVCGKKNNANKNQDDGWKKSREPFDGGKNATENLTSSWGNATAGKNPPDSRGKGKGGGSDISIWGKAVDSVDKGTGERIPEGSWGKAAEKWGSRYGFIGSKAPWNGSLTEPKNQVGGWGNAGGKLGDESKERTVQNDRCKPLGGNRGFGGWNKSGMGNQGDTDQQEIWDRTKTFDGGHCSGGRRGKRGSRGGRDQFGRGRSFGRGQSFGWSKEGQGYHGKDPLDSWGNGKDGATDRSTWGKAVNFVGEGTGEGTKAVWNQGSKNGSWGNAGGSSWNKQGGGSSWTKQNDVNTGDESRERTYQNDSWGNPSGGDRGFSGWNKNGMGNKDDAGQQESWDRTKTFGGGSGSGGRRGRGGSRGGRDQFGRGRPDRGCFRGRCGSDSGAFGGRGQSDHGTGDGTSSANLSSWSGGQAGVWGRGKVFDGGEDNRSDRGGYGGRGGSDRGGFRDRGQSNRGGYGGRDKSDRGGFQGRGRSEREGFGGRGRGRKDQNGDWYSRNDSVEDKTSSWNKGSISAEGWKSNDSGDRWNQDGGDKAQNCNSGWKPSKGTMGRGGANGQAGGWNRGTDSSKDGGPADTWGKPAASSWGSKGRQ